MSNKYWVKDKGNFTWSSQFCGNNPGQDIVGKVGELIRELDNGSGIINIEGVQYGFCVDGFRPATPEEINSYLNNNTYEIY